MVNPNRTGLSKDFFSGEDQFDSPSFISQEELI